jgi:hypothetical protein
MRKRGGGGGSYPAPEEEETSIQGSRKARREIQYPIYF